MKFLLSLSFLVVFFFSLSAQNIKYVFFFIGDGMGQEHFKLGAADAQFRGVPWFPGAIGADGKLLLPPETVGAGLASTNTVNNQTTDSAASGTALACGFKTFAIRLGFDPEMKPLKSLAIMAKEASRKTAVIASIGLNHATPGAFYAHAKERYQYSEIALQAAASGIDYFGAEGFIGNAAESKAAEDALLAAGYVITHGEKERAACTATGKRFTSSPDTFAQMRKTGDNTVTIAVQIETALKLFEQSGGFFIFTEGSKIDHMGHDDDTFGLLAELREFNDAVGKAFAFAQAHPSETLIVVTADHNTGGVKFIAPNGSITKEGYELVLKQTKPFHKLVSEINSFARDNKAETKRKPFGEVFSAAAAMFGMKDSAFSETDTAALMKIHEEGKSFNAMKFMRKIQAFRDRDAGLVWNGGGHFPYQVPVRAFGPGAQIFNGEYENSDVCRKIANLAYPSVSPFGKKQSK